ncbi:MAG: hypothetical protein VX938_01275, partial [Myxococcota bacterium]|nr:hypothetical protein [Myxococcota bacterium]
IGGACATLLSSQRIPDQIQVVVRATAKGAARSLSLQIARHGECDKQSTSMEVVREVASLRAAQARLDALRMNREDDLEGAARALNLLARTLELGPEGKDPQIQELIISLRKDARRYGRWMSESDRKHHSQVSYTRIRSRREDGTSIRLLES